VSTHAPGPLLVLGTGLCALAFSTTHPAIMAAILVVAVALMWASRTPMRGVLMIAAILGVGVALLNPFVQANGDLILVQLPDIPIFDMQVTLEEVIAGVTLGARAAAVTILVMAVLALADPDRLLQLASRLAPRSAIAASVAARMVPTLRRDAVSLVETARLRGRSPLVGSWMARGRGASTLALPLVGSALERSLDVAEAMAARGYGAGTPTRRPRLPWNAVDRATMGVGVVTCLVATASIAGRLGRYRFYPTMDRLGEGWALVVAAGTTVVGLILAGRIRR
jgi:energy-coupling factor transport system permease protein